MCCKNTSEESCVGGCECVSANLSVNLCTFVPWCVFGGQRATSGVCSCLLVEAGSLLFFFCCTVFQTDWPGNF